MINAPRDNQTAPRATRALGAAAALLLITAIAAFLISHCASHRAHQLTLSDGTRIYYRGDSKPTPAADYPRPREIRLDGDFYIEAPVGAEPLVLRSRLMVITLTGASADSAAAQLRVTAFSHQPGEEVDILSGHAEVHKAYDSPYHEPDILDSGEMSMVNKDIDLMEKEHCDRAQQRQWADALIKSAHDSVNH